MFYPKIGCFNFKPQYLLNDSSPKNDLYSVRKRSTRAFKSILKLLRCTGSGLCAKTLHASCLCLFFNMFQNILRPTRPFVDTSELKGSETKTGKMGNLQFFLNFLSHFLDFGDITSIFREMAPNAIQYCLKILFKSLLYHTISWCV